MRVLAAIEHGTAHGLSEIIDASQIDASQIHAAPLGARSRACTCFVLTPCWGTDASLGVPFLHLTRTKACASTHAVLMREESTASGLATLPACASAWVLGQLWPPPCVPCSAATPVFLGGLLQRLPLCVPCPARLHHHLGALWGVTICSVPQHCC